MRADKTTKITVMGHESTKVANLIGTLLDDHSRVSDDVCDRDTFCLFVAVSEDHPIGDFNMAIVWQENWSDTVLKVLTVLKSYNLDGSHQQAGRRGCKPY